MGILMLAVMSLFTSFELHQQNALRSLLGVLINGAAFVLFAARGRIDWRCALVLTAGAVVGGYGGARYARRLPAHWLRRIVLAIAWSITAVFWARGFGFW